MTLMKMPWKAAFPVSLNHDDIVPRHGLKQLRAFDLTRHVLYPRDSIRRCHHDLRGSGMPMSV